MTTTTSPEQNRKKVTTRTFLSKKSKGETITMLTAYDYPTALALDRAGIDSILVGDSVGMVVLGYETTLPVTMEDMLHHCKAVARGAKHALLIGDMPFLSFQVSVEQAVQNAGRFLQEAGMDAVKLEGGQERAGAIEAIVSAGIPVMGHLGLTPQSVHLFGGFRAQGKTAAAARKILDDARALEAAGCFALVLEAVPSQLAGLISGRLTIPTIGIGAGPDCDGQVLVSHDLLGFFDRFTPRFAKRYAELHSSITEAVQAYLDDIRQGKFPAEEHSLDMDREVWQELQQSLNGG